MSLKGKLKSKLKDKIVQMPKEIKTGNASLWRGPETDGITFSLLNQYLADRERFRIYVKTGLTSKSGFNHRIEYGNMWHVCEEAYHKGSKLAWVERLKEYCGKLIGKYPSDHEIIRHWYSTCKVQFAAFIPYEPKLSSSKQKATDQYVFKEKTFSVKFDTSLDYLVRLRGKWDGVFIRKVGNKKTLWIKENKTKGEIDEIRLRKQLKFDLQTMIYLIALDEARQPNSEFWRHNQEMTAEIASLPIGGVLYNVIRRPFSRGKGNISKHKGKGNTPAETEEHFYQRLSDDYLTKEPGYWFMQWDVEVTKADIERFKRECLNPLLNEVCIWWEGVRKTPASDFPFTDTHYRMPYGCYSALSDGRGTPLDDFVDHGSTAGLTQTDTLFPELDENE